LEKGGPAAVKAESLLKRGGEEREKRKDPHYWAKLNEARVRKGAG